MCLQRPVSVDILGATTQTLESQSTSKEPRVVWQGTWNFTFVGAHSMRTCLCYIGVLQSWSLYFVQTTPQASALWGRYVSTHDIWWIYWEHIVQCEAIFVGVDHVWSGLCEFLCGFYVDLNVFLQQDCVSENVLIPHTGVKLPWNFHPFSARANQQWMIRSACGLRVSRTLWVLHACDDSSLRCFHEKLSLRKQGIEISPI